jgi:hypothetical protein
MQKNLELLSQWHVRIERRTTSSVLSCPAVLSSSVLVSGRTGQKPELCPVLQDRTGHQDRPVLCSALVQLYRCISQVPYIAPIYLFCCNKTFSSLWAIYELALWNYVLLPSSYQYQFSEYWLFDFHLNKKSFVVYKSPIYHNSQPNLSGVCNWWSSHLTWGYIQAKFHWNRWHLLGRPYRAMTPKIHFRTNLKRVKLNIRDIKEIFVSFLHCRVGIIWNRCFSNKYLKDNFVFYTFI